MGFQIGKQTMNPSRCVSNDAKFEAIDNVFNYVFGYPAPVVDGPLSFVIYNGDDNTFINKEGDVLTVTGGASIVVKDHGSSLGSFTALDIEDDLVVVDATGGVARISFVASAGGSQNLFETIRVSGQSDVVADSTTDILTLIEGIGIVITTSASGDSVTFSPTITKILYSGEVVGDVTNADATVFVDNVTTYNGVSIVTSSADQIRVHLGPRIKCSDNTVIFFEYAPGILSSPATDYTAAHMRNWKIIWAGIESFDATEDMLAGHKAGDSDLPEWDTPSNWLKRFPGHSDTGTFALFSVDGVIQWVDTAQC